MWRDEAPRESGAARDPGDSLENKRRILAAVDDLRIAGGAQAGVGAEVPSGDLGAELALARRKLVEAESARHFLEDQVQLLEQRALEAIAETGRLRRALDEAAGLASGDGDEHLWRRERLSLRKDLEAAQLERSLLTSALTDSESELARMARTIDLMARKLHVAS